MKIATTDGQTVEGYCLKVEVDGIQVRTSAKGVIRIARSTLSQIRIQNPHEHQLVSLGRTLSTALRNESQDLLTPAGPFEIVALPATVAWGIVATPFCLIGDLSQIGRTNKQQTVIISD
jgi:hypothetical protein